jgi:hypothetical protein
MFHTRFKPPAACEAGRVSLSALFRLVSILGVIASGQITSAQVDSSRKDPQLAYNQQRSRQAPQVFSADSNLENRAFLPTNAVIFRDFAPRREALTTSGQLFSSDIDLTNSLVLGEFVNNQSCFRRERAESSFFADIGLFDQSHAWRIGQEGVLSYRFRTLASRIVIHCGPSFKPPREAFEDERCFGLLFRFDFGKNKRVR